MSLRSVYYLVFYCFITLSINARVIIFDLNGVLITENKSAIASEIGYSYIIKYCIGHMKIPHIRQLMYKTLEQIDGAQTSSELVFDDKDTSPLPQVMVELEKGQITYQKIMLRLANLACVPSYQKIFISRWEQWFIERVIRVALDPVNLAQCVKIIPKGLALVKKCAEARDASGNLKNELYILSNMDPQSFELIKIYKKELFCNFKPQNIYISGYMGRVKPEKAIYETMLKESGNSAQDCVFIDDQKENVEAAAACGLHALHLQHANYKALEIELQKLDVL